MNAVDISAYISAGGVVLSVIITFTVVGIRFGQLTERQKYVESNMVTRDQFASLLEKLARIEGMFELKLKE